MRLVMMGTGPFAVPTFRWLLESEHQVVALVTRPASPVRTRGKSPFNPMREEAERRGLEVAAPDDVNDQSARAQLAGWEPQLLVVCDYGQILSADTLSVAPLGGINLHGSLLPRYRGAAPVNWALLCGETETGVTVIHMTPKLDAGPCLVRQAIRIDPDETAEQLEKRLAELGPECVRRSIEMLQDWDGVAALGTPQDPAVATRAPRLKKSDGQVDWLRPAARIRDQVRGLKPWPGTFTQWQRNERQPLRLILDQVSLVESAAPGQPGTVVRARDGQLWVATGDGVLSLDRLQPAGKRTMDAAEFLRGYPIAEGTQLASQNSPSR